MFEGNNSEAVNVKTEYNEGSLYIPMQKGQHFHTSLFRRMNK